LTDPFFPYTTLFRSTEQCCCRLAGNRERGVGRRKPCRERRAMATVRLVARRAAHWIASSYPAGGPLARTTAGMAGTLPPTARLLDRKSTRLNSSHVA